MECVPAVRLAVNRVARPLLRVPLPSEVEPSKNVTVPVAVEGETVAVKVTVWPELDGLRLEPRAVVVLVLDVEFTVSVRIAEVLAL
jgi:hypothetical protein